MSLKFLDPNSTSEPQSRTYDEATISRQATMLANRVKKTYKHLAAGFARRQVGVFRLYNWDIPEIRALVDWYDGHLVIGEYVREQTSGTSWLEKMASAVALALDVPSEKVHLRRRTTRPKTGDRYQRLSYDPERFVVQEGDLKFWVDLGSYLDTGLFADHRETRALIRKESPGQRFLNLYAYTGAFSAYAALGGAASTTSVDLSGRYLEWAEANLELNGLAQGKHRFIACDVRGFLREAAARSETWDLIFLDPPSFSTREGLVDFEILKDHPYLIRDTLKVLAPGGTLYFSTNHQRFAPKFDGISGVSIEEITSKTVPVDYKNRNPHRCFKIVRSNLH